MRWSGRGGGPADVRGRAVRFVQTGLGSVTPAGKAILRRDRLHEVYIRYTSDGRDAAVVLPSPSCHAPEQGRLF